MDIFEEADRILAPLSREQVLKECRTDALVEDKSDWVTSPIGKQNDDYWSVPGLKHWQFVHHPPSDDGGIIMCNTCECSVLKLKKIYQDKYPYWCLHCGPQETISDLYNK